MDGKLVFLTTSLANTFRFRKEAESVGQCTNRLPGISVRQINDHGAGTTVTTIVENTRLNVWYKFTIIGNLKKDYGITFHLDELMCGADRCKMHREAQFQGIIFGCLGSTRHSNPSVEALVLATAGVLFCSSMKNTFVNGYDFICVGDLLRS